MTTNKCGQCGFENDLTRKFCQNCGARLAEVAGGQEGGAVPAGVSSYRGRLATPPRGAPRRAGLVGTLFKEIVTTAILALMLAALIQAVREPDDVPVAIPPRPNLASLFAADIQSASESAYPRSLDISPELANNFLASRIGAAAVEGGTMRANFVRAYVIPREGHVTLGVEQRLGNLPIYLHITAQPLPEGQSMSASWSGGSIGRLPIARPLLNLYTKSFATVLDSLATPLRWIGKASDVEIRPDGGTIRWAGSTR